MLEARQARERSVGEEGKEEASESIRRDARCKEAGEEWEAAMRVLEELKSLHLDEISPREALNKLYELKSEIERAGK